MPARSSTNVEVERLSRPACLKSVRDGGIYDLQPLYPVETNLFLKIARVDKLFVKVPSSRGFADYLKFIKLAQSSSEDIRSLETSERFENLEATLEQMPALAQLRVASRESIHYLVVHKLQNDRLRGQTAVEIPSTRFGLWQSVEQGSYKYEPAMFQEYVRGATLWSMFDFEAARIMPRWRPFVPAIAMQLMELLDTGLVDHIDWNVKNFVFDEHEERLFYVDLKPTTFVARHSNERNLNGIREHFLR